MLASSDMTVQKSLCKDINNKKSPVESFITQSPYKHFHTAKYDNCVSRYVRELS